MFAFPKRLDIFVESPFGQITINLEIACDPEAAQALWEWFRTFDPNFRGPNESNTVVPKERQLSGPMANLLGGPSDPHLSLDGPERV